MPFFFISIYQLIFYLILTRLTHALTLKLESSARNNMNDDYTCSIYSQTSVMKNTFIYMYEGCPSKSWTFVVKRDFVSGILWNLYDMFIYIYDTFSTNMDEITVKITKLWTFTWGCLSVCGARRKLFVCIFREGWSNVLTLLFLYKLKW